MTMKNSIQVLSTTTLMICTILGSWNAEARDSKTRKAGQGYNEEKPLVYHQAAPRSTYFGSTAGGKEATWGLGFSTIQNTLPGGSAAITAILNVDELNTLQGFFYLPATSPFNIGALFLYKRTVTESRGAGFHIGGGLGMANVNDGVSGASFALNLNAVAGFHFELPGIPHVMVHLDGGPSLNVVNTSPTTTTNFQIAALSPALGASVLYVF